uniref:DUF402 domain-containing protein n=1 Tax=Paractinoplanes polyasparticus TaxID=2856853 RepID=UPI001C85134C|nr:DUF402 domain-containing protein [Actinoplanes polyasparticus]
MDVEVVFTKYGGQLHRRSTMRRLGVDEYGTWLGASAGTTVHSGIPGRSFVNEHVTVRLVPVSRWWTAIFFAEPNTWDVYCDITTPAEWLGPGSVTLVDLDLDLLRNRDTGHVDLLDEDEFAANTLTYDYPADVVNRARSTADRLAVDVAGNAEPFGSACLRWLDVAGTSVRPGPQ